MKCKSKAQAFRAALDALEQGVQPTSAHGKLLAALDPSGETGHEAHALGALLKQSHRRPHGNDALRPALPSQMLPPLP